MMKINKIKILIITISIMILCSCKLFNIKTLNNKDNKDIYFYIDKMNHENINYVRYFYKKRIIKRRSNLSSGYMNNTKKYFNDINNNILHIRKKELISYKDNNLLFDSLKIKNISQSFLSEKSSENLLLKHLYLIQKEIYLYQKIIFKGNYEEDTVCVIEYEQNLGNDINTIKVAENINGRFQSLDYLFENIQQNTTKYYNYVDSYCCSNKNFVDSINLKILNVFYKNTFSDICTIQAMLNSINISVNSNSLIYEENFNKFINQLRKEKSKYKIQNNLIVIINDIVNCKNMVAKKYFITKLTHSSL